MTPGIAVIPVALLGGVLGLDTVSFPQAMWSRPIVAATLSGALMGEPANGLVAGAALELIALETLPVGASRYPEWGSASVVGGAIFASQPQPHIGSLVVAVLGALLTAWLGGWTMVKLRQRNAAWSAERRAALDAGSCDAMLRLQIMGLNADLARAALLTGLAYAALVPIERAVLGRWTLSEPWSRAVLLAAASSVAAGASWKNFHATPGARWFLLGGLAAALLMLVIVP
jgi:mannose/fructose/N-acetylgalactosamine-specific phosphotransferase system component IIC